MPPALHSYDGALGVIVGIAAAKALLIQAALAKGLPLPASEESAVTVSTNHALLDAQGWFALQNRLTGKEPHRPSPCLLLPPVII